MGIIFLCMVPLLFLLRNARDLHPHTPSRRKLARAEVKVEAPAKPELAGALH